MLNYLARLRTEPEPKDESSADEQVPERGAGWRGTGPPMSVGEGYVVREICDGQSFASPSRWPIVPESHGSPQFLMELARGKVKACTLKRATVDAMVRGGFEVERTGKDRPDHSIDYRYLDALKSAGGPEVSLGAFAVGVRLAPGVRMPRLPALYAKKRKWWLRDQADPLAWQEEQAAEQGIWRQNYSSLAEWSEECKKIMDDQAEREGKC